MLGRQRMGGKAASLSELSEKFVIPAWFVISPQAFLDCLSPSQKTALNQGKPIGKIVLSASVREAIENATQTLVTSGSQRLAVRSSATSEDGEQASFAGQLESYLNVPTSEVVKKVCDVWYSAFSDHVSQYRKIFDKNESWIPAVIVQHMVQAEMAGVAFSADPVTGDRKKCVINATHGLADKLVSGEVNGDTYYTSREGVLQTQMLNSSTAILNQTLISDIVALVFKVEAHFGLPQDIEWAIQDGKVYLLQARPITSLKHATLSGERLTLWDNSNIVESYSGVTSPLTFSFARYVYEHVYIEFCQFMGVTRAQIECENNAFRNMLGFVNGHVYYNLLNWYRVLSLFPGFKMNQNFMEQMMGVKEPLPAHIVKDMFSKQPSAREKVVDSLRFIRTLGGLVKHQIGLRRTIRNFYDRLNEALTSERLESLSLDQLVDQYRALENKLLKRWDAPLINDFLCMIAFGVSRKLLEKYAGEEGLRLHNDIMIGQGDIVSAEPAIRIRKMADIACQEETIVERLIAGDVTAIDDLPALKVHYDEYLKKFGDRCLQELKLESFTLEDEPAMLLQAIGYMARRGKQQKEIVESHATHVEISNLFKNKIFKKWMIVKIVSWAKIRVRDRENLRFERTRVFGRVRKIFLEIGLRLHELKYLTDPRDIFFMEVSEILGLIEGTGTTVNIQALIQIRKKQQEEFDSQPAPPNRFETSGAACHAFKTKAYATEAVLDLNDSDSRKGIGCCQGIVRAPVRVIHNPRQAELKPGEIMVAQFTDPGWITLFANAAGIIVERGSLLSHSAIVAREMGIPAIVAIEGVMSWLKTGDVVEMNGATGIVTLSNREESNDKK